MDKDLHKRLVKLWDGNSQYIVTDGIHYEVLTPNGKDDPIFIVMPSGTTGYSDLSTGFAQAPEPGKKAQKRATPKKK